MSCNKQDSRRPTTQPAPLSTLSVLLGWNGQPPVSLSGFPSVDSNHPDQQPLVTEFFPQTFDGRVFQTARVQLAPSSSGPGSSASVVAEISARAEDRPSPLIELYLDSKISLIVSTRENGRVVFLDAATQKETTFKNGDRLPSGRYHLIAVIKGDITEE